MGQGGVVHLLFANREIERQISSGPQRNRYQALSPLPGRGGENVVLLRDPERDRATQTGNGIVDRLWRTAVRPRVRPTTSWNIL